MYNRAEEVYFLDLCILSYQLHAQTLYWPMDPYYEEFSETSKAERDARSRAHDVKPREAFMSRVHATALPANFPACQGPGPLKHNTQANTTLDPTLCQYDMIDPLRPGLTRPAAEKTRSASGREGWILYDTPRFITDRIGHVFIVDYDPAQGPLAVTVKQPIANAAIRCRQLNFVPARAGTDLLYCFEGGTGAILRRAMGQPLWSMMGFVLARQNGPNPTDPYDVYVVFRGSRSGLLRLGKSFMYEKGNADWVTDLDLGAGPNVVTNDPTICQVGAVSPGFGASAHTTLPTVRKCLEEIQAAKQRPPARIHVTGHSLGAALAAHFTSAMLLGTTYGPDAAGPSMPASIQAWPWKYLHLLTFAMPPVGDATFQNAFNLKLSTPSRMIGVAGDHVIARIRHYGVGIEVAINPGNDAAAKTEPHHPMSIRRCMIRQLQDTFGGLDPQLTTPTFQPWMEVLDFKQVLISIQQRHTHYHSNTANRPTLMGDHLLGPAFNTRLLKYLDVLKHIVPQDQQAYIENLRKAVGVIDAGLNPPFTGSVRLAVSQPGPGGGAQTPQSLNWLYTQLPNLYNATVKQFLGLCLFLSQTSVRPLNEAANSAAGDQPFSTLPMQ